MVAIDFTRSNGDAWDRNSLHYIDTNKLNEYEHAILACGEILEQYDTDK